MALTAPVARCPPRVEVTEAVAATMPEAEERPAETQETAESATPAKQDIQEAPQAVETAEERPAETQETAESATQHSQDEESQLIWNDMDC
eukprot:s6125_g1.t1